MTVAAFSSEDEMAGLVSIAKYQSIEYGTAAVAGMSFSLARYEAARLILLLQQPVPLLQLSHLSRCGRGAGSGFLALGYGYPALQRGDGEPEIPADALGAPRR